MEDFVRIVNLKGGPMDVRFTGEPLRCMIHWLQHDGRRGGTLPCQGNHCPIHTGRPREIALISAVRRRERPSHAARAADEIQREKMLNFRRLPEEVRARLLAEARKSAEARKLTTPESYFEMKAADIMWPPKPAAPEQIEYEPIVVDLPIGAAIQCTKVLNRQPWRGNRVLFTRPHVGADTDVRIIESGLVGLPEPISVPERMARHWGFAIDRARVELDQYGNAVLTFAPAAAEPYVAKNESAEV